MPVKIEDRPIKAIREEVIDQLVMNYAHQEITLLAFENRLDLAIDTEDRTVLLEQVADLDLKADHEYQQRKAAKQSKDKTYFDGDSVNYEKITKVLSSSVQNGPWVPGENIRVTSILSDITLDFTDAIFNYPVINIQVFNLLTSNTIYVPEGVRVVCKTKSYLSSDSNQIFGSGDEKAQTIVVHGNSILSSTDIKLRVTMKERWLKFADGMKDLFN
jgi:hypothetical protein